MSDMKTIVGICLDMCPQKELKWREENGLLHEFEITKESQILLIKERNNNRDKDRDKDRDNVFRPKADKRKVVKQFSRSSAGQRMQTPEELRPIKVLLKCTDYLLSKVAVIESVPWNIVYDYIFDRLRSVRQDMAIQCSEDIQCLTILEQCVRFHLFSLYYFGDEEVRLYDKHLNDIHLRECLQSLLKRYDCVSSLERTKNRPLFESIYLVYNLGSNDALLRFGTLEDKLKFHQMIQKCYRIGVDFEKGFYYPVIQSIASLKPPILALLASTKVPKLHSIAIKTMSFAYSSPNTQFPISLLCKWLCPFESNQHKADKYINNLCNNYGLVVANDCIVFNKNKFNESAKPLATQKWSTFEYFLDQISLPSLMRGRHERLFIEE